MRCLPAALLLSAALVGCGDDDGPVVPDGGPGGSPGGSIVFAAALEGATTTDLYVVEADGSGLVRLTDTPADERFPRWSPDRSRIAYMIDDELFVVDSDGTDARRVTGPVGRDGFGVTAPAWSQDGAQLIYAAPRPPRIIDGEDQSYATILHAVNLDGSADGPFAGGIPESGTMSEPAWADAGWLAFRDADDCLDCPGDWSLAMVRTDGTDYRTVAEHESPPGASRYDLDWVPGSTRWVYTERGRGDHERPGAIATCAVGGGPATILVDAGAHTPRWSPDAARIAFLRDDGLHVMAADGSGAQQVVAAAAIRGLDW